MGMRKSGLKQGDRVLLFSGNDLFFPVVFMGIIMAGGIFTGANPRFVARELAYQLQDSGAKYLLCAPSSIDTAIEAAHMAGLSTDQVFVFENLLEQHAGVLQKGCRHWSELVATAEEAHGFAWEELSTPQLADTTLALNYSSGTTGRPKGVEVTHKNYVANVLQATHNLSLGEGNLEKRARARWLCFLPMYHAMAQTIFIASALYRDTPVYVMPKFDLRQMLEYTERYRITDLFLVPPVAVTLAKNKNNVVKRFNLSSVEVVTSGAAPLGREICAEVESIWPPGKINVKQGWGMTEYVSHFVPVDKHLRRTIGNGILTYKSLYRATCTVVKWDPREVSTSTSVGEPIANCELKIMAEDGVTEIVERNQRGEMWVRAPNVMKGYWRNPRATRETKTEDGWLKTGDIAYVDNHGKFYVVDRIKVS